MWASKQTSSRGFTIVELLIVVVVIAILAAITIVSYNGIQNRAKSAAAQAAASQAFKKITLWQIENPSTSPDLNTFNTLVGNSNASKYQYTQGANGAFCITATENSISYKVSETLSTPALGGCPGHNANGVSTIANLLTNTSLETDIANIQNIGNVSGRTVNRVQVSDAVNGSYVFRITANSSGQFGGYGSMSSQALPVGTYVGSLWIRSTSSSLNINPYFEGSASKTVVSDTGGSTAPAGTWRRITRTINVTSPGTVKVGFLAANNGTSTDYVEVDAFMLTSGSTIYNFANGSSTNWVWDGGTDSSTSYGLPL